MTSCPRVLMSAKSGAGDPSGGIGEDVAAHAGSDVVSTDSAVSATAAPCSRNPRLPNFGRILFAVDLYGIIPLFSETEWNGLSMGSVEEVE